MAGKIGRKPRGGVPKTSLSKTDNSVMLQIEINFEFKNVEIIGGAGKNSFDTVVLKQWNGVVRELRKRT